MKLLPPIRLTRRGLFCFLPVASSRLATSHQVIFPALGPEVSTAPPRPSMRPSPTMRLFAAFFRRISALHDLPSPPAVPQRPPPLSKSLGLRDAKSVTLLSTHSVTLLFSTSGPDRKALALPLATRRTAWPAGQ